MNTILLRNHESACRWRKFVVSVVAALTTSFLTVTTLAAPPQAWTDRGCASSCHSDAAKSAKLQSWTGQLGGLDANNFRAKLNTQNSTMKSLADDHPPNVEDDVAKANDRAIILQYLLAVRDVPLPGLTIDPAPIGSPGGTLGNLVIVNERSNNVTYTPPSISPSGDFSIDSETCSSRTVAKDGGTCTITIRFKPVSGSAGPRSSKISMSIAGTGGDNNPGVREASLSATAQLPLELTPAGPLGFITPFTTPASTSAPQGITVNNRLDSNLRFCLVDLEVTGTATSAPADFKLVDRTLNTAPPRCTTLSAPGAAPFDQLITFTPTAGSPRLARFTAERDDGAGNWTDIQIVDLEGNAGPLALFSGASLNGAGTALFDGVRQDKNMGAALATVTLTNAGAHKLKVVSLTASLVTGASTAEYVPSGCGSVPIESGKSCDITVSFDPVDVGLRASQLRIEYIDFTATPTPPSLSSILSLLGRGFVGPELEVRDELGAVVGTTSLIDFGRQNINVLYPRRFTLKNIGTEEALLLSAAAVSPSESGFRILAPATTGASPPACAALVGGGTQTLTQKGTTTESCIVDVWFSPTQDRTYTGQLSIHAQPQTSLIPAPSDYHLAFAGQGANEIPVLLWQDGGGNNLSTIDFPLPATAVGSATPPSINIKLANMGKGAASLKLLNLVGRDAASFVLELSDANACPVGELARPQYEGACDVVIRFSPQTGGSKQASLQLVSTGSTPQPVLITAQAAGPAGGVDVSVTPPSVDFKAIRIGAESAAITVTITNNGSFPAVVKSIQADKPFTVVTTTCAGTSFTLAPNASCLMAVRFLPTTEGPASGTIQVAVDGRASPAAASLRGDGMRAADVSSGGCSMIDGKSVHDPVLWLLALCAAAALRYRSHKRRRMLPGSHRTRRAR
jgi:hypothetical protein